MRDGDDILGFHDDDLQREIARQTTIHERIKEGGGFSLFQPRAFQMGWFQEERKVTTLIKGNQVGGTTCLVVRMISACLGTKPIALGGTVPPEWNMLRIKEKPGNFLLMGQSFTKSIPEVILPKLKEFINHDMLVGPPKKNNQGVPAKFSFRSGATLLLGSYDQEPASFEGSLWNGVGFDEPPPREIYVACRRGTMRTRGWMMFTMTPLKEMWIYDELHLPALQGKRDDVAAFECPSHMNCSTCNPGEGVIDHEELKTFFDHLTPKERQARELGIPMDISDVMFSFVKPETHVSPNLW